MVRHRILIASLSVGVAVIGAMALGVGLVGLGLRYRWPVVLDGLRRLSRVAINPGQLETAGQPGAYASVIEHRGRVSGRLYRTPIVARRVDDGFLISLTYGERADWVKNVIEAGSANLVDDGVRHDDLIAEVVGLDGSGADLSPRERRTLRWFGIETGLRLAPGSSGSRGFG